MTKLQTTQLELQIDVTFWHEFTKRKLEVMKLSEAAVPIYSTLQSGKNTLLLTHASFDQGEHTIPGELINFNTLTQFKEVDKKQMFNKFIEKCKGLYASDVTHPIRFLLITYGDLKKYDFYFIGGCPAYKIADVKVNITPLELHKYEGKFNEIYDSFKGSIVKSMELKDISKDDKEVFMLDPSSNDKIPGWPIRNLINNGIRKIHCIRPTLEKSFTVEVVEEVKQADTMSGWFTVPSTGKISTQIHHLAESINPELLANQAVELNLQLMKWQLFRDLDLPALNALKVLLVGSGTLGCNVARVLMGWGIQNLSFIDYGVVSYSNPVRQSLYQFKDCVAKRNKAERAAESVKEVFPGMHSEGIVMSIPMPGHPIGEKEVEQTRNSIEKLDKLVQEHDVVFLLGDSRECRWLPSMLCSYYNKLCITVGLGFDSFVVMRHGDAKVDKCERPSCYFCADIVAPTDSLSRRTLDQQCTVTRPGISYIASALAVEMMVSIVHNKDHNCAKTSGKDYIPHQLRGYLNTWKIEEGEGKCFSKCIACSDKIKEAYKERGTDMVIEAINNPKSLERIVGIEEPKEFEIEVLTDSEDI